MGVRIVFDIFRKVNSFTSQTDRTQMKMLSTKKKKSQNVSLGYLIAQYKAWNKSYEKIPQNKQMIHVVCIGNVIHIKLDLIDQTGLDQSNWT